MVYRVGLTYEVFVDLLEIKYNAGSTNGYRLPPCIIKTSDLNLMLRSLIPNEVKLSITIDDISLRSNITTKTTLKYTNSLFFVQHLVF